MTLLALVLVGIVGSSIGSSASLPNSRQLVGAVAAGSPPTSRPPAPSAGHDSEALRSSIAEAGSLCSLIDPLAVEWALGRAVAGQPMVGSSGNQACGYPNVDGKGYAVVVKRHRPDDWARLVSGGTMTDFGAVLAGSARKVTLVMRGVDGGHLTVIDAPCCTVGLAQVAALGRSLVRN